MITQQGGEPDVNIKVISMTACNHEAAHQVGTVERRASSGHCRETPLLLTVARHRLHQRPCGYRAAIAVSITLRPWRPQKS
jgi:hypothetical protein